MSEPELAIDIRGLTKRFGKSSAVSNIDLTVRRGTTLGLLGPNGAGKSTKLRMLMGMLRPTTSSWVKSPYDHPQFASEHPDKIVGTHGNNISEKCGRHTSIPNRAWHGTQPMTLSWADMGLARWAVDRRRFNLAF